MKQRVYLFIMSIIGILSILAGELEPTPPLSVSPGQAIVWTKTETIVIPHVEFFITNEYYHDCSN